MRRHQRGPVRAERQAPGNDAIRIYLRPLEQPIDRGNADFAVVVGIEPDASGQRGPLARSVDDEAGEPAAQQPEYSAGPIRPHRGSEVVEARLVKFGTKYADDAVEQPALVAKTRDAALTVEWH